MRRPSLWKKVVTAYLLVFLAVQGWPINPQVAIPLGTSAPQLTNDLPGQSATLLPNGDWLLLGGMSKTGPRATAVVFDPLSGVTAKLKNGMNFARAWHSATLLPDGRVLIVGGIGANGEAISASEVFDAQSLSFETVHTGLQARSHHSATLLTDGRVLVAGGVDNSGQAVSTIELWDWRSGQTALPAAPLTSGRRDHRASLLPDGTVLLWGGTDGTGKSLSFADVYDPDAQQFSSTSVWNAGVDKNEPFVEASLPEDGATAVPVNSFIAVRFSKPLRVQSVNPASVTLSGPTGQTNAMVMPAEGGMLAFVLPTSPLQPATEYTITVQDATDTNNLPLVPKTIRFTTAGQSQNNPVGGGVAASGTSAPPQTAQPLQAAAGVTAVSGQVLRLDMIPLRNVTLQIGNHKVRSDAMGHFLLDHIDSGHQVLVIDATTASGGGVTYGRYEDGVDIIAGRTNVLPYTIWMTPLDMAHAVTIPSPTTKETVITNPSLPGLELHLPANTVIQDANWKTVTQISITPIPVNQPPFPLPRGVNVPIYFTIQPGGAYIYVHNSSGPQGGWLVYPNSENAPPGTMLPFWNYDPDQKGWYIYGQGRVTADGKQIVPNPGVVIYQFSGAMVGGGKGFAPGTAPAACSHQQCRPTADPVDPATGLFVYENTDFILPDTIPIKFTRTYRQNDSTPRAFGIGATDSYDIFLTGTVFPYTYLDLVLPDGSRIHYPRISPGTSYTDAVYQHTASPTMFYGSTINWNSTLSGWDLHLKDGELWHFPDSYQASRAPQGGVISIQDRFGNTVTITRDRAGNVQQITSPNGRWLQFANDTTNNRVNQITDNTGRTVKYTYDSSGRLSTVTDPNGNVTTYTYDSLNEMTSIKDGRGIVYLQNQFDGSGRVSLQTLANGGTYQFAYTTDSNGNITQTNVTDPNGNVHQIVFSAPPVFPDGFQSGGYPTSETLASGTSIQQTFTYSLTASGNFVSSVVDPLNRTTTYTYDAMGNVTSATKLAGTANAATTSYTYEPKYNRIASIADPLGNTTTYAYDDTNNRVTVTDPIGAQTIETLNSEGQLISATDPLNESFTFAYNGADLSSITDPLHNATNLLYDGAGRIIGRTDPLGNQTQYSYDTLNDLTAISDPSGGVTKFTYDANRNLLSVTDPQNTTTPTTFTYNNMDWLSQRTDALGASESFVYDGAGNLTQYTDRRGKVTQYTYDALNRRTFAGFGFQGGSYESTITYNYDDGNRLTSTIDSLYSSTNPSISRAYDGVDRLTSETTPQGSISYAYDLAGRRTSATVAGQTAITYSYDNDSHLTQVAQGSAIFGLSYDAAGRRTSLTLPNGIAVQYSYDASSHITGITYAQGSTVLGTLTYVYDGGGHRSSVSGSWAGTNIPAAVTSATYNAENELTNWGGTALAYDANGNMTSDGVNSYTWDGRNHLVSISGTVAAAFQYDALGRRTTKTINTTSTAFLYDQMNVVQELSGSTPTANLIPSLNVDEILARTDSGGARYFLTDAARSTVALSDSSAVIQTQYTYEPFGSSLASGTASSNSFQFTARENDGDTLYFYRARYYSPTYAHFLSQDPAGFHGGIDLYAYAGNDPLNFTDPFGLKPPPDPAAGSTPTVPPGCDPLLPNCPPRVPPPPGPHEQAKKFNDCVNHPTLKAGIHVAIDNSYDTLTHHPGFGELPPVPPPISETPLTSLELNTEMQQICYEEFPLAPLDPAYQGIKFSFLDQ